MVCTPKNLNIYLIQLFFLLFRVVIVCYLDCIVGRYDLSLPIWSCITCHKSWKPELQDLIRSGYWPGSIAFQTVYQIDLFTSFEQFKVTAPGLSRQAFVKMLEHRSRTFGRVKMLRITSYFINELLLTPIN